MVLADPRLVETQTVEPPHQLQIALDAGGGVFVHGMEGRQEGAVAEGNAGHEWKTPEGDTLIGGCYQGFPDREPRRDHAHGTYRQNNE